MARKPKPTDWKARAQALEQALREILAVAEDRSRDYPERTGTIQHICAQAIGGEFYDAWKRRLLDSYGRPESGSAQQSGEK